MVDLVKIATTSTNPMTGIVYPLHQARAMSNIALKLLEYINLETIDSCREDTCQERPACIKTTNQTFRFPPNFLIHGAWIAFLSNPNPKRPPKSKAIKGLRVGSHKFDPWWELCAFGTCLYILSLNYELKSGKAPCFSLPTLTDSLLKIKNEIGNPIKINNPLNRAVSEHVNLIHDSNDLCRKFHLANTTPEKIWDLYINLRDKPN